jgi:hypothetical protein
VSLHYARRIGDLSKGKFCNGGKIWPRREEVVESDLYGGVPTSFLYMYTDSRWAQSHTYVGCK